MGWDGRRGALCSLAEAERLTKDSWTAPQKHVAVAASSVDHPSLAPLLWGMYGLDLSAVAAMMV